MSNGNVEMPGSSKSLQLAEICVGDVAITWGKELQAVFFLTKIHLFDIPRVLGIKTQRYSLFLENHLEVSLYPLAYSQTFLGNAVQSVHPHPTPKFNGVYHHMSFYNGNLGVSP